MRRMEGRVRIEHRIGRDERDIARMGHPDQMRFGRNLDFIVAAAEFDIEPLREQRLQAVEVGSGGGVLPVCTKPRQRPFAAGGQGNQSVSAALKVGQSDTGLVNRVPIEVGRRNQGNQIVITLFVLRQQCQPIEQRLTERATPAGPFNRQQRTHDRLHPAILGRVGKFKRAIHVGTVGDGDRRHPVDLASGNHRLG